MPGADRAAWPSTTSRPEGQVLNVESKQTEAKVGGGLCWQ